MTEIIITLEDGSTNIIKIDDEILSFDIVDEEIGDNKKIKIVLGVVPVAE